MFERPALEPNAGDGKHRRRVRTGADVRHEGEPGRHFDTDNDDIAIRQIGIGVISAAGSANTIAIPACIKEWSSVRKVSSDRPPRV